MINQQNWKAVRESNRDACGGGKIVKLLYGREASFFPKRGREGGRERKGKTNFGLCNENS